VAALLDQGSAFIRSAARQGTNIAAGLDADPRAYEAAQLSAASDFDSGSQDTARDFFSGCIVRLQINVAFYRPLSSL